MPNLIVSRSEAPDLLTANDTKAVLLVGGLGTRLRTVVPSAPKPLAPVGDRPFLELLIQQLAGQGIRNLVLCTGYLADQIQSEFGDGNSLGVSIEYSKEPHALGTGGAVKFAERFVEGVADFLVMNGDSFLELDLRRLIRFHRTHRGAATLAVVPVENAGRYGTVRVDGDNRVTKFLEKTSDEAPGLINAGIYVFSPAIFEYIPPGPVSLEKDVFPRLLSQGVYAVREQGVFIDIGTPNDYAKAQELSERLRRAAQPAIES
jgi:NDP-sugar pyrophosphorylase family protein